MSEQYSPSKASLDNKNEPSSLPAATDDKDDRIIQQGLLQKRGNASCGCQNKHQYFIQGCQFKQGTNGKSIKEAINLQDAVVKVQGSDKRDFTVQSGKTKIKLRATNEKDRDEWIQAIQSMQQKKQEQDIIAQTAVGTIDVNQEQHYKQPLEEQLYPQKDQSFDKLPENSKHLQEINKSSELIDNDKQEEITQHEQQNVALEEDKKVHKGFRPSDKHQRVLYLRQPSGEKEVELDLDDLDMEFALEGNQINMNYLEEQKELEGRNYQDEDDFQNQSRKENQAIGRNQTEEQEDSEPLQRSQLPFLKDPKHKVSFWTFLKDVIGKDITRISMPVYFNHPLSIMQRMAAGNEYTYLLDQAIEQTDDMRRLAFIMCFQISVLTHFEKFTSKPFNPLLGETFEYETPTYKYISESISHHPPIVGLTCIGKSGFTLHNIQRPRKPKFTGKSIKINNVYNGYLDIAPYNERYEIINPAFSLNNLIFGTMYMDIKDQCIIKNLTRPGEHGILYFQDRGWNKSTHFKVTGEVFNAQKECVYKIEGKWNESASIINVKTGERELVWQKTPYPEHWDFQYGFSQEMIQMNYLTNSLRTKIAPTDSRLRPDLRALENGEMKVAVAEKNRLEEKQRLFIRYHEKNKIDYKPCYYEEYKNPLDNDEIYYRYNGQYFEKDKKDQDWSRLPDIFSEQLPPEIEDYFKKSKKK